MIQNVKKLHINSKHHTTTSVTAAATTTTTTTTIPLLHKLADTKATRFRDVKKSQMAASAMNVHKR